MFARKIAIGFCVAAAFGCATPPSVHPLSVGPLQPKRGERVVVDQAMLLVDASGSIGRYSQFPAEKGLVQSFVSGMPQGKYEAGTIEFGGFERDVLPLAGFNRSALRSHAAGLDYLSEGSPLYKVLEETGTAFEGKRDRAAVVVFTDGMPTDPIGREIDPEMTLGAARDLAKAYDGKLCIHAVQVGAAPEGTNFLRKLTQATGCGSHRFASALGDAGALHAFQREIFLGAAPAPPPPPVKRAAPGDADGDGVTDDKDKCPGTLAGARVDARGCWTIPGLLFETNSAEITPESRRKLVNEVLPVIRANPGIRLRIDGHTDARGAAAYNQKLSERRAQSVRAFLVSQGVKAERLEARGFGEAKPVAPNDTRANMQKNRRTELTTLGR